MSFCPYCDKNIEGASEVQDGCLDVPPGETFEVECPFCGEEIEINWEWEKRINVEEPQK